MRIITDSQYMKQRLDKIIMIVFKLIVIHETENRQNNYDCINLDNTHLLVD